MTRTSRHIAPIDGMRAIAVVAVLASEVDVVPGWNPLFDRGEHHVPESWMAVLDALA